MHSYTKKTRVSVRQIKAAKVAPNKTAIVTPVPLRNSPIAKIANVAKEAKINVASIIFVRVENSELLDI